MSRERGRQQVAKQFREAEALLGSLGLGRTFTLSQLHRRVERHRGRQVH